MADWDPAHFKFEFGDQDEREGGSWLLDCQSEHVRALAGTEDVPSKCEPSESTGPDTKSLEMEDESPEALNQYHDDCYDGYYSSENPTSQFLEAVKKHDSERPPRFCHSASLQSCGTVNSTYSIMAQVQQRLNEVSQSPELASFLTKNSVHSEHTGSERTTHTRLHFHVSMRTLVCSSMMLVLALACAIMFVVTEVFMQRMHDATLKSKLILADAHSMLLSELRQNSSGSHAVVLAESIEIQIHQLMHKTSDTMTECTLVNIVICLLMLVVSLGSGLALGRLTTRPLIGIGKLIEDLCSLNFTHCGLLKLGSSGRSKITEVRRLQASCCRLFVGVNMFARFLPESVVRGIVCGDDRATRLHVSRRIVTIMFSDIQDFTTISESLKQEDLLFLLTRYLSVMIRVIEAYEGVVTEILGDGLLVFWNTPDDVEDHPAKACAAALAQQQVLKDLNLELSAYDFPHLAVRIGLHTGRVLTGNIGSEAKMKFGCMGDPINLASRLEGLCKFYGVHILCSGSTYSRLPSDAGFVCRRLDVVQVKGKKEPTQIYEVIGLSKLDEESEEEEAESNKSHPFRHGFTIKSLSFVANEAMNESATALRKFDILGPFMRAARNTLGTSSMSTSTEDDRPKPDAAQDLHHMQTVTEERKRHVELYEKALWYYQKARFLKAKTALDSLLKEDPGNQSAILLLERASQYIGPDGTRVVGLSDEQLATWTGTRVMTEK